MIASLLMGKRIWRFLFTPAGRTLLAVLALCAWTVYQRADATAGCEAAELARELAETKRQILAAEQITESATRRANESLAEMVALEQENAELKSDIDQGKITSCPIPDDVRRRLLRIK